MLLQVPGVLSAVQVQQCRELLDAAAWIDGSSTAGTQSAQVKNNQQLPEQSTLAACCDGSVVA